MVSCFAHMSEPLPILVESSLQTAWDFLSGSGEIADPQQTAEFLLRNCPSSDDLRLIGRFEKGGSGSSGVKVRLPAADAASGDLRWCRA
jgi:hypothetical protein